MTERNKKLVRDYGPRALERAEELLDILMYWPADLASVTTDEESKPCMEKLEGLAYEVNKLRHLIMHRLEEAGR